MGEASARSVSSSTRRSLSRSGSSSMQLHASQHVDLRSARLKDACSCCWQRPWSTISAICCGFCGGGCGGKKRDKELDKEESEHGGCPDEAITI